MPPPGPVEPLLLVTIELFNVTVAERARMPPPAVIEVSAAVDPLRTVTSFSVSVPGLNTSNTRSMAPPSMIVVAAPRR
jgi:hypothetical protein